MTLDEQKSAAYKHAAEFTFANPPGSPVLAWPGTRDLEPLRTRIRGSAWVMASGHAVVRVAGYAGGIALSHIEPDPTRQPAVPELEFVPPNCPFCGDVTDTDGDGFVCIGCHVSWGTDGRDGEWDDPLGERCPATRCWDAEDIADEQCALARDHDGETHYPADGIGDWRDSSDCAVIDSYGKRP
jgi:hypothetical protein